MNRRFFLKRLAICALSTTVPQHFKCTKSEHVLRFGIITDVHYADREPSNTRFYKDSIDKLHQAIDFFNEEGLDFIIELGDLKDQDVVPEKSKTIEYLNYIEKIFKSFNGPSYHVLGNHDVDSISKEEFLQYTSNPAETDKKTYYSFIFCGIKCIVLDANFNEDGTPYDSGGFDWSKAFIPREQQDWLSKELSEVNTPVIVFIHQLLDSFSDVDKAVCVGNAEEVVVQLEKHNILAVFQGHYHDGHYSYRNNIHYWTMKGMIEGTFPENNSYAIVEVHQNFDIEITCFKNSKSTILYHNKNEKI